MNASVALPHPRSTYTPLPGASRCRAQLGSGRCQPGAVAGWGWGRPWLGRSQAGARPGPGWGRLGSAWGRPGPVFPGGGRPGAARAGPGPGPASGRGRAGAGHGRAGAGPGAGPGVGRGAGGRGWPGRGRGRAGAGPRQSLTVSTSGWGRGMRRRAVVVDRSVLRDWEEKGFARCSRDIPRRLLRRPQVREERPLALASFKIQNRRVVLSVVLRLYKVLM